MAGNSRRWWRRRRRPTSEPAPPLAADRSLADSTGPPPRDGDANGNGNGTDSGVRASATPSGAPSAAIEDPEILDRLSDYVRVQVRSGVHDIAALRALTVQAAEAEIDEPGVADETARVILYDEIASWHADAGQWAGRTDPERLDRAFERLAQRAMVTLPALEDMDVLAETVRIRGCPNGAIAYLISDIWYALDNDELPLTVLGGDGLPAPRTGPLVADIMDILAEEGLLGVAGRGDGASIVVTLHWRRRPRR